VNSMGTVEFALAHSQGHRRHGSPEEKGFRVSPQTALVIIDALRALAANSIARRCSSNASRYSSPESFRPVLPLSASLLTRSRAGSRFVNAYFRAMIFYLEVAAAIVLVGAVGAVVWIMVFAIIAWS
jgi:hypothetical protein